MGQSTSNEVVKERSADLLPGGESSKVAEENDDRGLEGGVGSGAGALVSCFIGHLGRR